MEDQEGIDRRLETLEKCLEPLKELSFLVPDGKKKVRLMDVITKHVMDNGFSEKARQFRQEFFTKTDFQSAKMTLVHQEELKRVQADMQAENKRVKDKIGELQGAERETGNQLRYLEDGVNNSAKQE